MKLTRTNVVFSRTTMVLFYEEIKVLGLEQNFARNFYMNKEKYWSQHWHASVLYKQFLTPIRDGIWNRRQVSAGDRGGPSHTTQISSGIGPPGT